MRPDHDYQRSTNKIRTISSITCHRPHTMLLTSSSTIGTLFSCEPILVPDGHCLSGTDHHGSAEENYVNRRPKMELMITRSYHNYSPLFDCCRTERTRRRINISTCHYPPLLIQIKIIYSKSIGVVARLLDLRSICQGFCYANSRLIIWD